MQLMSIASKGTLKERFQGLLYILTYTWIVACRLVDADGDQCLTVSELPQALSNLHQMYFKNPTENFEKEIGDMAELLKAKSSKLLQEFQKIPIDHLMVVAIVNPLLADFWNIEDNNK